MYSLHPALNRRPRGHDADRHQEGRQQHEGHRNAVDAELVENDVREPVVLLDELEARLGGIEASPGDEAENEGDERRPQRDPARVVAASPRSRRAGARMSSAPISGRTSRPERIQEPDISGSPRTDTRSRTPRRRSASRKRSGRRSPSAAARRCASRRAPGPRRRPGRGRR